MCVMLTEEEQVLMCQTADSEIVMLLEAMKTDPEKEGDRYQILQGFQDIF